MADAVAKNKLWEEHLRKEERLTKISTNFCISDPDKISVLPEKPNHVVPQMNSDKAVIEAATAKLASYATLKNTGALPVQKYPLPVTGNMEYGFFSTVPLTATPTQLFNHTKASCDVTQYASDYFAMKKHSVYANPSVASGK